MRRSNSDIFRSVYARWEWSECRLRLGWSNELASQISSWDRSDNMRLVKHWTAGAGDRADDELLDEDATRLMRGVNRSHSSNSIKIQRWIEALAESMWWLRSWSNFRVWALASVSNLRISETPIFIKWSLMARNASKNLFSDRNFFELAIVERDISNLEKWFMELFLNGSISCVPLISPHQSCVY